MADSWEVRSVRTGGRAVVDVLDDAFADDPWMTWALPDRAAVRSLFSLFLRTVAGPVGEVLVASPTDQDQVAGVAILLAPGREAAPDLEVGEVVLRLHGHHAGRALDADAVLQRHRPVEPMWTLHTLAVRTGAQGSGAGSALLEACLQRSGKVAMAVETSSPAARAFYERRGFKVQAEIDLSTGHGLGPAAPTVWLLQHPAP